jgi:tetratricopeptide (TPR) repeat protein
MFELFGLISLLYLYRAGRLAYTLWQDWGAVIGEPFRRQDRSWASEAAFYLAVPPSVLVHELFHALVVWGLGGKIVDYGFYFYAGVVVPDRIFPPVQSWWISTAGTIGSLLFGIAVFLIWRNHRSATVRYFAKQVLGVQIYVSLIGYPVLTLIGFNGDWNRIYNFSATPILSGIAAVIHVAILVGYFVSSRRGWGEMPAFSTPQSQSQFNQLQQQATRNPQNHPLQTQYLVELINGGATRTALTQVNKMAQANPRDPDTLFLQGFLQRQTNRQPNRQVSDTMQRALDLGLNAPARRAQALKFIGEYQVAVEKYDDALRTYDQAIASINGATPTIPFLPQLYFERAQLQRRRQNNHAALQDTEIAIQQATALAQMESVKQYENFRQQLLAN